MNNQKGLSLVEALVAAVIFVMIAAGLTAVFFGANRQIVHARERATSAQLGKLFIDPLQNHVRQDTWSDSVQNKLFKNSTITQNVNNTEYTAQHTVTDSTADSNLRKVVTRISWNESSF